MDTEAEAFLEEVQQHPVAKVLLLLLPPKINMNHPIHKRNQVSVKKESRLFRSNVYPLRYMYDTPLYV